MFGEQDTTPHWNLPGIVFSFFKIHMLVLLPSVRMCLWGSEKAAGSF